MFEKARYVLDDQMSVEFFMIKDRPFNGSIKCVCKTGRHPKYLLVYFTTYSKTDHVSTRICTEQTREKFEAQLKTFLSDYLKEEGFQEIMRFNYNARLRAHLTQQ